MKGCLGILLILAGIPLIPVGVGVVLIFLGIGVMCAPETSATASARATARSDMRVSQNVTVNVGTPCYDHYDIFPKAAPPPPPRASALECVCNLVKAIVIALLLLFIAIFVRGYYTMQSIEREITLERAIQSEKHPHPKP